MTRYVLTAVEKGKVELTGKPITDPQPQEIQVRVHTSLISPGTERATLLALENTGNLFPADLGYSAAGIVEKTGSEVTRFKVGDRVACFCLNHCSVGNVAESFCIGFDEAVSFEQAAFLALGVIALQGVRKTRIETGEAVMILGLGPVGQLALQIAKANGALPVIGADRVASRIAIALASGSDLAFNTNEKDWQLSMKEALDGEGPHVAIESTGFPDPINTAFEAVRKFGRVALLGSTRGDTMVNFYTTVHHKALTVTGAHIMGNPAVESRPGFWTWKEDARAFLDLIRYRRINPEPLITDRADWQDAENLYNKLLDWDTDMMIPVINWV